MTGAPPDDPSGDDPAVWASMSRRAFTTGLGATIVAACVPGGDDPDASLDAGTDAPVDAPLVDVPADVPIVPMVAAAAVFPLALLSRPTPDEGNDPYNNVYVETIVETEAKTTYWIGARERTLQVRVTPEATRIRLEDPLWSPEEVSADEFRSGRLHHRIQTDFGVDVLLQALVAAA